MLETLQEMRDLLSDEGRWTQGENARDYLGRQVLAKDKEAVCWCLVGAAFKVSNARGTADKALRALKLVENVATFNDRSSHSEVLQLLDKAINENT